MKLQMPVVFFVGGFYEVEADSIEEAMDIVREHEDEWVGYHLNDITDWQMVPANEGDLRHAADYNKEAPIYRCEVREVST